MALQGTLDSFSLPDVLRLLADTGKTGCLRIEGDRGHGSVWVDGGAIVATKADRALDDAPVDEIVFELLRFGEGSFVFAADEQAPEGAEATDVELALRRAGELLDEWRELEAVVPSLEHQVAMAPELTVDKVTIDASRWTTLVALAKGLTVGELGESLEMGELAVSRTVSDLVELGVAVVEAPQAKPRRRPAETRRARAERRPAKSTGNRREPARQAESQPEGYQPLVGVNGLNGRNGSVVEDGEPTAPRVSRASAGDDTGRGAEARSAAKDSGAGKDPASGNGLPRRSRATGQRSGGRQVGGSAPKPASPPPSSPFTNGSVMPPAPTSGPGLSSLPPFNNNDGPSPLLSSSLDAGPLGPSPLPPDTGQSTLAATSSLPPDLSWATEDEDSPLQSPPMGTPPVVPPAPGGARAAIRGSAQVMSAPPPPNPGIGPATGPMPADGDTAPHVAVMSPGAQLAIEATVGRSGGGPGVVPAAGATPEETMQRGALLGFLSSVRQ